jgi:hypothetical protein
MKNPSAPSLIGSLISYIALLPGSLSRIQQRIQKLTPIKTIEIINAVKAIKLDVVFDTRMEKRKIIKKGVKAIPILIGSILSS